MKQEKEEKETDTGIDKYVQKLITQEKQKKKRKTNKQIYIYNIYIVMKQEKHMGTGIDSTYMFNILLKYYISCAF